MTRGELAKECGVNIEALRYYESFNQRPVCTPNRNFQFEFF